LWYPIVCKAKRGHRIDSGYAKRITIALRFHLGDQFASFHSFWNTFET
jgi:hypothetical protein